jgi:hypothetical protein
MFRHVANGAEHSSANLPAPVEWFSHCRDPSEERWSERCRDNDEGKYRSHIDHLTGLQWLIHQLFLSQAFADRHLKNFWEISFIRSSVWLFSLASI